MNIFEATGLALAIVAVAFAGLWLIARYFAKNLGGDATTVAARQTAMQIGTNAFLALGAIGTVTALIFTARSANAALASAEAARASVEATRDGQITERYTRAVEQLYASSRGVRTGGIYALERIARDSPGDRPTVMQLLAAYVRDESPKDEANPTTDIRVAAIVVARNPLGNGLRTDLHDAGLTNTELHEAQFHGADLSGTQLGGVEFQRADLTAVDLGNANLSGARPGPRIPPGEGSGWGVS